ncbi:hypothetical protein [Asanoa hainanensis]|nr:hypothetical protein [Asanoa hainanensis]
MATVAALVGSMAAAPAQAGAARPYRVVDLGFVGQAVAINDKRQVVGNKIDGENSGPVVWERGRHVRLDVPAGGEYQAQEAIATDINNRGQVVGYVRLAGVATQHAVLWERGVMRDLGTLGGQFSHAFAINDRGQVVGTSQNADGVNHGFVWEDGRMTSLGLFVPDDINNRGQISGFQRYGDVNSTAALLRRDRVTRLDLRTTSAMAINNAGTVVGYLTDYVAERNTAYLWRAGRAVAIGPFDSTAFDINDRGEVLMVTSSGVELWRDGRVTSLSDLGVTPPVVNVGALNNRGDIVASPYDSFPRVNATVYLR